MSFHPAPRFTTEHLYDIASIQDLADSSNQDPRRCFHSNANVLPAVFERITKLHRSNTTQHLSAKITTSSINEGKLIAGRESVVYCVATPETRVANQSHPCIPEPIRVEQVTISITYRIAVGPQQGHNRAARCSRRCHFGGGCGKVAGFSLHAGVAARADQRQKLERLCRYISRPAIRGGVGRSRRTATSGT